MREDGWEQKGTGAEAEAEAGVEADMRPPGGIAEEMTEESNQDQGQDRDQGRGEGVHAQDLVAGVPSNLSL